MSISQESHRPTADRPNRAALSEEQERASSSRSAPSFPRLHSGSKPKPKPETQAGCRRGSFQVGRAHGPCSSASRDLHKAG
eukprot:CAMPEP_0195002494 /NCGR_PEP_ID=MMETSP0326_2-20130528/2656_1 /TAXON_ID=2866 ORGANISM="Crypthecodinium cohnii, Strain Seligo" /NCGR_SAMPLE_ID=MMETSP0326_2 /ASSEMBLY_ACC=CAM_ASM_000348 /LENGTH=80 /DNA_ID=CAMNT_0040006143 /DNA_START=290 /DNA_END=529 /DNA_ORIENTATION=+